jgi:glycosyltransferase involved in cell wall biosynthesis
MMKPVESSQLKKNAAPPSVSVIIPAYNAAKTLRACLESVSAAEYGGTVEVLVVDDASTDDTPDITTDLGCRLIRRNTNQGPAQARNAGARAASGDILLFVDADTEMRRDTIRQAVAALTQSGMGAVNGMYEPEPINAGFFPAYYAYLKFHAFTNNDTDRMTAFSGQCGAIYKTLFHHVGGYNTISWGVDIENEEFGLRVNEQSVVGIAREFRVRHNFPAFRQLAYIFSNRVYWWVLFSRFSRRHEAVLMTRGFGYATASPTAALLFELLGLIMPVAGVATIAHSLALTFLGLFACGYAGFWKLCFRRRGLRFALGSVLLSFFFSFLITGSAARAYAEAAWRSLTRRSISFSQETAVQV